MKIALTYGGSLTGTNLWLFLATLLLLGLWIPSVWDKTTDFEVFKSSMLRQYFPMWVNWGLVVALPAAEVLAVALLMRPKTNLFGMYLSTSLLLVFTGYVSLAIWLNWVRIPCGCSKLISNLSWEEHFWFNLSFLALSAVGIFLSKKQRGSTAGGGVAKGGSAKRRYT